MLQKRAAIAERMRERLRDLRGGKTRDEVEETKAVCKPEGEGEGEDSEFGNLLRAWDAASQGAREKFKARVGLVAGDGLDIPASLRRSAS
jgi:hypothetical protein